MNGEYQRIDKQSQKPLAAHHVEKESDFQQYMQHRMTQPLAGDGELHRLFVWGSECATWGASDAPQRMHIACADRWIVLEDGRALLQPPPNSAFHRFQQAVVSCWRACVPMGRGRHRPTVPVSSDLERRFTSSLDWRQLQPLDRQLLEHAVQMRQARRYDVVILSGPERAWATRLSCRETGETFLCASSGCLRSVDQFDETMVRCSVQLRQSSVTRTAPSVLAKGAMFRVTHSRQRTTLSPRVSAVGKLDELR